MSWDSLGTASILLSWIGLMFLIWKWKGNSSMTFSQHAAQYRSSYIYYFLLWLFVLPFLYLFLITDFYEKLSLASVFIVLAFVTCLLMLVAATIPETGGLKTSVHRFAAFSMATLFLPAVILIAFTGDISTFSKAVSLLSAIILLVEIVYLTIHKRKHPRMLWIQGSYIAIFYTTILVAYYL